MRVSSPIGDLPFEPRALRIRNGGLEIEGAMGAWPAHVAIGLRDVPAVLRLIATPAALAAAALAVAGAASLTRRNRLATGRADR